LFLVSGNLQILRRPRIYVLPKFEVKVTAPKYIELKEGKLVATINAKYTYGKSIKGIAHQNSPH
jgi:Macroglobulin domain MG3